MLLTAVLSVIASVIAASLIPLDDPKKLGLLAATTLAGCWAVLIPGKIWEGRHGDAMVRRVIMAALGLGIGLGCSYLDALLRVGWFNDPQMTPVLFATLHWIPPMIKNASYFALLFLIPRWWLLADSRRPLRLNPWLVIVPCVWAWIIPMPWTGQQFDNSLRGCIVAGMVAVLVQLASPWEDPAVRRRMI